MDSKQIKKKLLEENNMEVLLEALGCDYIKREQRGNLITAQLPERFHSSNKRSVQVYLTDILPAKIRTISNFKGDIFSLVSFLKLNSELNSLQDSFKESMQFITKLFGWKASYNKNSKKKDYTAPLKMLASKSKSYSERVPNLPIDERSLNNFMSIADNGWYEEGINIKTQEFYEIGFDYQTHRITIPIRNEKGELVGVKGRLIKKEDITDYNPKYKYIYRCNMSQEWFNMYNAKEHIISEKKVYIFESEKSVMKMHQNGIKNVLAISSSDISEAQVLMIKNLGLDIEIILCYDKDKGLDEVKEQAKRFTNRNVFAIIDLEDSLGEKDSPIDLGIDVWNQLLDNHCYQVTAKGEKYDKVDRT